MFGVKTQRQRIDAVAQAAGAGAIRKDMPEVSAAAGASDLGACHPVAIVFTQLHGMRICRN